MEEVEQIEIKLSQQQKLSLQLSQLENKINLLSSKAHGNNVAIYYLDKAIFLLESAKTDLDKSLNDIPKKIKLMENILSKVEITLQQSS